MPDNESMIRRTIFGDVDLVNLTIDTNRPKLQPSSRYFMRYKTSLYYFRGTYWYDDKDESDDMDLYFCHIHFPVILVLPDIKAIFGVENITDSYLLKLEETGKALKCPQCKNRFFSICYDAMRCCSCGEFYRRKEVFLMWKEKIYRLKPCTPQKSK